MTENMKNKYTFGLLTLLIGLALFGGTADVYASNGHGNAFGHGDFYHRPGNSAFGWAQGNGPKFKYTTATTDLSELQEYIKTLQALLAALQNGQSTGVADVDVLTRTATDIEDDRATLRGTIDFNNEDQASVYFQWGENRYNLTEKTAEVNLDDNDDEDFERIITGLDHSTKYYFRAVAKDENGDKDYGAVYSFVTDNSNLDKPEADTDPADNVTDDSAELNGWADMNDFKNGRVFFVYGEDENAIEDVDNENRYSDIDEDGDNLQKVTVDSDLDDNDNYALDIDGLDNDTKIYFRIGVEYKDDNNDLAMVFGDVDHFTTDN